MALTQSLGGERAEDRALAEDLKKGIVRARRPVQDGLGVGGAPARPWGRRSVEADLARGRGAVRPRRPALIRKSDRGLGLQYDG